MEIMQKTFLGMSTSGAWVEQTNNTWLNILIAVVAIAAAVIAVAATIASGGAALTIILAAAGAVIKIGLGAAVAFYAVNTLHIGESGFYLPEYQLTPEAIFRNEIIAFDINFFNPQEPETEVEEVFEEPDFNNPRVTNSVTSIDEEVTFGGNVYRIYCTEAVSQIERNGEIVYTTNPNSDRTTSEYYTDIYNYVIGLIEDDLNESDDSDDSSGNEEEYKRVFYQCADSAVEQYSGTGFGFSEAYAFDDKIYISIQCESLYYVTIKKHYSNGWEQLYNEDVSPSQEGIDYAYRTTWPIVQSNIDSDSSSSSERITLSNEEKNKIALIIFERRTENKTTINKYTSPAYELQSTIASWYLVLRNMALVALLSILVYIGIRITLTSVAGDKAKYKQMLVDWVVALALVFLMHYIMAFAVTINEKIIEAVASIGPSSAGSVSDFTGDTVNEFETTPSLEAAKEETIFSF